MIIFTLELNGVRSLRDWSLITGRGATKWEGGACEVVPL